MDILIIGGTRFLGKALTDEIIRRDHNLTLFNRGISNPDFKPNIEQIHGDREEDLDQLGDRHWDVVIDTCGYFPRIVNLSVEKLKENVKHYIFISTISVYEESHEIGKDEHSPIATIKDETIEDNSMEHYGPLKALCEREVIEIFGEDALIIRPGLIVGPHDPTNRFTYWLTRIRDGGKILAPSDGTFLVQIIDVRDLAIFCVDLIEKKKMGIYNVTGPDQPLSLQALFETISEITGAQPDFNWIPEKWLSEQDVAPFVEIPLWIPSKEGAALMQTSNKRAKEEGLQFRDLEETTKDTLKWYDSIQGDNKEWYGGLDRDKEKALLTKYSMQ